MALQITKKNGTKGILKLRDVAYCPDFVTNIVSFRRLKTKGIFWDTVNNTLFRKEDSSHVCILEEKAGQHIIEESPTPTALVTGRIRKRRITSRHPRPASKGDGILWHARMGHLGPMSLHKLGTNSLGVVLRGPSTSKCEFCSRGKIRKQISRRPPAPEREVNRPCQEIHIDWTDLETSHEGYVRVMFITDRYSGMVFPYFMSTHGEEKENLRVLKDFVTWMKERFGLKIQVIRSDNELGRKRTLRWLRSKGIEFEPSAPRTQDQNGRAERSGGVIMEKSRAMRISANLPHDLWKEIVNTAVYLHNRTPREAQAWKTPYEVFYSSEQSRGVQRAPKKPQLVHLKAYGCRAYAMTEDAQLKRNRKRKLDPRAYIGYLVGYDSTNIFRIWIPHKGEVISTRDVLFDEHTFFNGKSEVSGQIIAEMDSLVARVRLPEILATNERLLEEDEEVLEPADDLEEESEEPDEGVSAFDEKEDYELARALEEALLTPPPSEVDPETAFHIQFPTEESPHEAYCEACSEGVEDEEERFEDFANTKISSALHGAFVAGSRFKKIHKRNLPSAPKTIRDLKSHPFREQFRKAQEDHLESHRQMQSFHMEDKRHAKGQRVLHSMWVFTYKTDKHGFLQKCKARLVICGNQQAPGDLPTRATTLASMAFRALMAITAKFDLETIQMDAVNAFVNCRLDEVVYMRQPPGFETGSSVLRLRKALYGLRRSPLLWQKELTSTFRELGYKEVPQEPCVMINGGVIAFFYVDDIVICHRKQDEAKAKATVAGLQAKYTMSILGSLKWFLGVHVLRDRAKRTLWLSQEAYVEKLANQYGIDLTGRLPDTPMMTGELLPSEETVSHATRHLFQKKTGSILFAAITTRPDIAFAASRLARFNQNPGEAHHEAANRVIQYLFRTKGMALRYGGDDDGRVRSFICSSDASFADNTLDRKSSQGYIMLLFGGPIAWKANKQDTVTTSSTEAELLALSQTAREAIFISRLLKALMLRLNEPLVIECDNTQTLRLVTEEALKLATKLRHVDIHNHWLRQESEERRVSFQWVPTESMLADGLTKALPRQRHEEFVRMIRLDDITERLQQERKMEILKDRIIEGRTDISEETTVFLVQKGIKGRDIWWPRN